MSSVTSSTADQESPLSGVTLTSVRHRLLRGSAWVFGAKIDGTIILGLVLNVLLARLLPPGQLGAYFTSYTLVLIGSTIAQLGLDRAVVRLVSAALAVGLPGRARNSMRTVFLVSSLGALAMGVLLITGVGGWLARDIYHANVLVAAMPLIAGWLVITAVQGSASKRSAVFSVSRQQRSSMRSRSTSCSPRRSEPSMRSVKSNRV